MGQTATKHGAMAASARTCSVMGPGPVEQLIPSQSGAQGSAMTAIASMDWPPRVVPEGSMVAETATGRPGAPSRQAMRAALRLRASWTVSTSSTSAPPWASPSTCCR